MCSIDLWNKVSKSASSHPGTILRRVQRFLYTENFTSFTFFLNTRRHIHLLWLLWFMDKKQAFLMISARKILALVNWMLAKGVYRFRCFLLAWGHLILQLLKLKMGEIWSKLMFEAFFSTCQLSPSEHHYIYVYRVLILSSNFSSLDSMT